MFGGKDKPTEIPTVSNKSVTSKDITTLIGEGCKVEGNFFIPTATRIDGIIKGNLTGDSGIVIGNKGRIEGNVVASEVVVYGNVTGNIETNKLELKKGCVIEGDLIVNNLVTEQGCTFNGRCSMKNNSSKNDFNGHDTLKHETVKPMNSNSAVPKTV